MKAKRDALDALFSRYIRARDHFTCQRCGTIHATNSSGLHCAHIIGRGRMSVRWFSGNAIALCYGCHRYLDTHPSEKERWVRARYGDDRYNDLLFRANSTLKADRAAIKAWLLAELKELGVDV